MNETNSFEAPDRWHWGGGERGEDYYTRWMYTDKTLYSDGEFGWECHIYHDEDGGHYVEFLQITRMKPNGDLEYSYPKYAETFDTEQEALEYAIRKAKELR